MTFEVISFRISIPISLKFSLLTKSINVQFAQPKLFDSLTQVFTFVVLK